MLTMNTHICTAHDCMKSLTYTALHSFAASTTLHVLRRARNGITDAQVNVDVCVFLFDLLFLDGDGMLQTSFRQRRQALSDLFVNLRPGYVEMANGFELDIPGGPEATQVAPAFVGTDPCEAPALPAAENSAAGPGPELLETVKESTDSKLGIVKRQCGVRCNF